MKRYKQKQLVEYMIPHITNTVCAWTEGSLGNNYSSTYVQVGVGNHTMAYDLSVPSVGDNVVLNMDNPVMTSDVVGVKGDWSPN